MISRPTIKAALAWCAMIGSAASAIGCSTSVDDYSPKALEQFDPTDPGGGDEVPGLDPGGTVCDANVTIVESLRHHEVAGVDESYAQLIELANGRFLVGRYASRGQQGLGDPWEWVNEPLSPGSGAWRYRHSVGDTLWFGGDARGSVSIDGGHTWRGVESSDPDESYIGGLPYHLGDDEVILAGEGVLYHVDGAGSLATRLDVPALNSRPDWSNGPTVTGMVRTSGHILAASIWGVMVRAPEPLGPWEEVSTLSKHEDDRPRPALLVHHGRVLAMTREGEVYASDDEGLVWQPVGRGEPMGWPDAQLMAWGDDLVAVTDQGIQVSSDDGANWASCQIPFNDGTSHIELAPDGTLWVVGWGRLVRLSQEK